MYLIGDIGNTAIKICLFPVMPPQLLPKEDRRYKTRNCVRINLWNYLQKKEEKTSFFYITSIFSSFLIKLSIL